MSQTFTGTPLSRAALLDRGYREYPPCFPHQGAAAFFQKCFRNSEGKKRYFININEYHLSDRTGWHPEIQFETQEEKTIDLSVQQCATIEEVEAFFERAFTQLDGKNYED